MIREISATITLRNQLWDCGRRMRERKAPDPARRLTTVIAIIVTQQAMR